MSAASFRQVLDREMQRQARSRPAAHVGQLPPAPDMSWRAAQVLSAQATSAPACLRTLGVSIGCSVADLKRAFRQLALRTHPDRAGGSEAAFMAVERAYRQALTLLNGWGSCSERRSAVRDAQVVGGRG